LKRINTSAEAEMIGEAVFARITDLKFIERMGKRPRPMLLIVNNTLS